MKKSYSEITPYVKKLAALSEHNNHIEPEMYQKHNVKRGLRDLNGNGVVTGLTEISNIKAKEKTPEGESIPCEGQLYYRGINVRDLVAGFVRDNRFGFEETIYLLLFSELPNQNQLTEFKNTLADYRSLPTSFVRDMILKAPGSDMMNILARCVLALYAYDENPDDISIPNVLRQSLFLISVFPLLSVYGYQSFQHYYNEQSLNIHLPKSDLSTAENVLHLLRGEGAYSPLEAHILDLALVLHAEHGGGNNSSFTTHVVTSSGTDTYSSVAAALGSLKGPRHGGANIKVVRMFEDMKKSINTKDKGQIEDYLVRLLNKEAFDRAGLIYGMGHAIYSKSDPRSDILKEYAKSLSVEKGYDDDYALYETVADLAPQIIGEKRKMYKGVSANVDFYSGLIYKMLELPCELYTPIFAISRIAGWSAHRIEEIQNNGKIIRPAYINVKEETEYIPLAKR
ncbi:MAG: citrate/2-methylcitrate synthase [Ruminococcaceae bacterium]|nr:citrate/2-methylcitrate synthase [Oscillospiraceae bacterium]